MELKKLLKNVEIEKIIGNADLEIKNIQTDSNSVGKQSLFVCLSGCRFDGHNFAKVAQKYGACAVVCEKDLDLAVTQIIVKNSRVALGIIASNFYGNVTSDMKLIGVVGTNGKTTTAHLIGSILNNAKIKCGVIGTLGTFYGQTFVEPNLTTPDPLVLHKTLYDMYSKGYKTVVMEVSAHALYFDKISGLKFAVGVFTNLTRDHLDFFGDMESYKQAKLKFFNKDTCDFIVANADDDLYAEISKQGRVITYGIENPADVFAIDIKEKQGKNCFILNLFDCVYNVSLKLVGRFNVYNALAAATVSALLGIKTDKVVEGIKCASGAKGRMEQVYSGDFSVYVDYAHTPDGLKNVLQTMKKNTKGRLICVFGCGGNRDVGKRALMGEISAKLSDFTVITSDNPRFEEPMDIIFEIEKGVVNLTKNYVIIQEREEGIRYAIENAKKGDVIIVAGKGSENYQEILGIKRQYNDKDTIEEIIRGLKI